MWISLAFVFERAQKWPFSQVRPFGIVAPVQIPRKKILPIAKEESIVGEKHRETSAFPILHGKKWVAVESKRTRVVREKLPIPSSARSEQFCQR